jgi:hypothetical protein
MNFSILIYGKKGTINLYRENLFYSNSEKSYISKYNEFIMYLMFNYRLGLTNYNVPENYFLELEQVEVK